MPLKFTTPVLLMEQILHQLLSFMKPYQKTWDIPIFFISTGFLASTLVYVPWENPLQSWPLHQWLQPWKSAEFWDLHQGWRVIYFERPPKTYHSLRALGPPLMPFVVSLVPHFLEESCLKICATKSTKAWGSKDVHSIFATFIGKLPKAPCGLEDFWPEDPCQVGEERQVGQTMWANDGRHYESW